MKIGEAAAAANCDVETVRLYEREGLLPAPPRSAGNYRVYDARHVKRLRFIRQCRLLDMPLAEIRALLSLCDRRPADSRAARKTLTRHCREVADRIAQLEALERQLRKLLRLA